MNEEGLEKEAPVTESNDSLSANSLHILKYSLPGVLHYLQMEWRRFDIERNEWEIERNELKSRIAMVEGQKKGLESIKIDFQRRIQMLEYALKKERIANNSLQVKDPLVPPPEIDGKLDISAEKLDIIQNNCNLLNSYLKEANALVSNDYKPNNFFIKKTPQSNVTVDKGWSNVPKPRPVQEKEDVPIESLTASSTMRAFDKSLENVGIASLTLNENDTGDDGDDKPSKRKISKRASSVVSDTSDAISNRSLWKTCGILRYHLDAVHSICWIPHTFYICSTSEDGLCRIWNVSASCSSSASEFQPVFTLRAHTGSVMCVSAFNLPDSSTDALVFLGQGSVLQVMRVSHSLLAQNSCYGDQLPENCCQELVGHSDMIWDVACQPPADDSKQIYVASASADGTVKIWQTSDYSDGPQFALKHTLQYSGDDAIDDGLKAPCKVCWDRQNRDLLWVGYRSRLIASFDVASCKWVGMLKGQYIGQVHPGEDSSDRPLEIEAMSQLYAFALHPTLPLLIASYGDQSVRFWDVSTFQLLHSMIAHGDAVTSVDIHPDGQTFASGSHDRSLRLWTLPVSVNSSGNVSIDSQINCIQESTCHRTKFDESIWCVRFSDPVSFKDENDSIYSLLSHSCKLATAGADGLVKLFKIEGS